MNITYIYIYINYIYSNIQPEGSKYFSIGWIACAFILLNTQLKCKIGKPIYIQIIYVIYKMYYIIY